MDYKIIGEHKKGRGACSHIIRSNADYFIIRKKDNLNAMCQECVNPPKNRVFNMLQIPKDLVEGKIPIC